LLPCIKYSWINVPLDGKPQPYEQTWIGLANHWILIIKNDYTRAWGWKENISGVNISNLSSL
jgi:hypothetical protein